MKNLLPVLVAVLSMALFTQCDEAKKAGNETVKATKDLANDTKEVVKDAVDTTKDAVDDVTDAANEAVDGMTAKAGDLSFEAGSWADGVLKGITSGNTTTFTLDQIPFEGEELSDAGKQQLDNLAEILKANPEWSIEVQGHTAAPTKKLANGFARAKWVQLKMNTRGITGKQISAKGYGAEDLLAGVAPESEEQKRITIALTKGE